MKKLRSESLSNLLRLHSKCWKQDLIPKQDNPGPCSQLTCNHPSPRPVSTEELDLLLASCGLSRRKDLQLHLCSFQAQKSAISLSLQIFDCPRLKFSEIPQRLTALLLPPDPIVINHVISVDPSDQKKTACYDIDVEVEEPLKGQMSSFLLSTANQQEISALDSKIHETIESINQLKIQRDFMLSFSRDPKGYIQDLLRSQSRDLKVMTDVAGNPEEERRAEFYHQPWSQEAVSRYFYCKIQQRRQELEQSLVVRNT